MDKWTDGSHGRGLHAMAGGFVIDIVVTFTENDSRALWFDVIWRLGGSKKSVSL